MKKFFAVFKKIVLLLFVGAVLFSFYRFTNNFLNSRIFKVKKIEVIGCKNSNRRKITKYFNRYLGKNIFSLKASGDLNSDEWVEKFEIKKKLPDTLVVTIYEKKPLIRYKRGRSCYIKTADNSIIRSGCEGVNVFVKGLIARDDLRSFIDVYQLMNSNGRKFYLYPSYFKVTENGYSIYGYYGQKEFLKNYKYFSAIYGRFYKKINYADLRIDGKIYIDGVKRERG